MGGIPAEKCPPSNVPRKNIPRKHKNQPQKWLESTKGTGEPEVGMASKKSAAFRPQKALGTRIFVDLTQRETPEISGANKTRRGDYHLVGRGGNYINNYKHNKRLI
jgi:hypothetical protein